MIKKHKRPNDTKKYYRINERIFASPLRVIDASGKQVGVLGKAEALKIAHDEGLDLVEIAPQAKPPVAKIVDFNKFLYQEEKKKREEKKKTKVSDTKEVRLGPFMSDNDLFVMERRARDFLLEGNKVKFVVLFSGRQITHPEFGHQILDKVTTKLSDVSKTERERHMEGRKLIVLLSPERKKQNDKEKNQEVGSEKV